MCIRCGTVICEEKEDTQELLKQEKMNMSYHRAYLALAPIATLPAMIVCVTIPQILFIHLLGIVPTEEISNILIYSSALAINVYIIRALYLRNRRGYKFTKILHIVQLILSPILILAAYTTTTWGPITLFFPAFSVLTLNYYSKRKHMFK